MANIDFSITEQIEYADFVNIISNIPSCIFFKDKELKYRFSTHFWAQLQSEDIVGKTDLDVRRDKENAIKAMEADRQIMESKKGCTYVIESNIDGEVTYLELIKEPIIDAAGEVIGIVGLINDVTENKLLEKKIVGMSNMLEVKCQELETSNEELKATLEKVEQMHHSQKMFSASMNHELRSPLNGIIGNLQLLIDDESLSEEQRENVKDAFISSQHMLEIVNELLDFAKLEVSGFTIKQEMFRLSKIIDSIEFFLKTQANNKGLDHFVIKDEDVPDCMIGDDTRITQIMNNFVSNAIKYTEKGSVTLRISYDDGMLIISCSDTGQGIAKESMDSLFDPFVRFNEKRNVNIQGTGLGLSVVKKIIENMNGEIYVESEVEVGSTFTAKIPVEIASEIISEKAEQDKSKNVNDVDFNSLKALCVDDSKVNAKVMVSLLKKVGISADVAYSAKEGIEKADIEKYDVIFMDHLMPEMNGLEAFSVIREKSEKNADTPVVMLTGNAESTYADMYKKAGLNGYLVKPVLIAQIVETISSVIRR